MEREREWERCRSQIHRSISVIPKQILFKQDSDSIVFLCQSFLFRNPDENGESGFQCVRIYIYTWSWILSIHLIPPVALDPAVYSVSKRSEYSAACAWGWRHQHLWADCLHNVEFSTSNSLIGLHVLLRGMLLVFSSIYTHILWPPEYCPFSLRHPA
jgi:hypothetical protein